MEGTDRLHDDLLVLQCQQGDVAGFEALVRRWQQPLLTQLGGFEGAPSRKHLEIKGRSS